MTKKLYPKKWQNLYAKSSFMNEYLKDSGEVFDVFRLKHQKVQIEQFWKVKNSLQSQEKSSFTDVIPVFMVLFGSVSDSCACPGRFPACCQVYLAVQLDKMNVLAMQL